MSRVSANTRIPPALSRAIGEIPHRIALAGGWIDQPFISRLNPKPPGAMVVASIEPTFRVMDRAGFSSGTRRIAMKLWKGRLPRRPAVELVRDLYRAENAGKTEPSGSQDMIGLIYPGINRLDYDFRVEGGIFPSHIESLTDARHARWLENVLHVLPIAPRPQAYNPLGEKNLSSKWVGRLAQSGWDCFDAIRRRDIVALGASFNLCMDSWETLLPHVLTHPTLQVDLKGLLRAYQSTYPGAMYSGCGGGYLFVASEQEVPGAFKVTIRLPEK